MEMGPFAKTIFERTYAHDIDGRKETWDEVAHRVTKHVMRAVGVDMRTTLAKEIRAAITLKKLIPAGRYLYASGRPLHQVCNCLLLRAHDSREGWSELVSKACQALMTGAGIGVNYSNIRHEGALIRKTGGVASGPIPLIQMVNECGRGIIQGGSRRSAIWAGLKWNHPDIHKFVKVKNWPPEIHVLKAKDFSFPAVLDQTNISVGLDDGFFEAYKDIDHPDHALAHSVYWAVIEQMLQTGDPGFSVDTGENEREDLRNAPLSASTRVLTTQGYQSIGSIVGKKVQLWTGTRWAPDCVFAKTGSDVQTIKIIASGRVIGADPMHEFFVERFKRGGKFYHKIEKIQASKLKVGDVLHTGNPPYGGGIARVTRIEKGEKEDVFCCDVHVEEHSFMADGVVVSNCCEVSSRETDDACNLASLNLGRIDDIEEMKHLTDIAMAFLLAGSVYTDVPYTDVDKVISKNRRLGLGLMGLHEWLLVRGKPYGPDEELERWLKAYAKSGKYANSYADTWGLKHPKKTRAIAPTGTTSIVAETTGGIEPIFCVAYKRRYLKGADYYYQYVIDPVAKRLIQQGVSPDSIEDAYALSQDVERRVAFQAWVQQFVDHAISSTVNLPAWGSEWNNADRMRDFGVMLLRYLPNLRGITAYPDGSRGGQPLNPIQYEEAIGQEGREKVEEQMNVCALRGGSCGD